MSTQDPEKLLSERIAGFLLGIGLGTAIGYFLKYSVPSTVASAKEGRGSGRQ
jgi:hypothetical protein